VMMADLSRSLMELQSWFESSHETRRPANHPRMPKTRGACDASDSAIGFH